MTEKKLLVALWLIFLIMISQYAYSQKQFFKAENTDEIDNRIKNVENGLQLTNIIKGNSIPSYTINERMNYYNISGVSIAIINDNRIEWAKSYGVKEIGTNDSITLNTLFQAASLSKPIAALTAVKLSDLGKIDLDKPFNDQLLRWKIPENEFTKKEAITPKMLILHTSGADVFAKRSSKKFKALPTVFHLPYKSDTFDIVITSEFIPGTNWKYCNGEYLMLQELIEEKANSTFNEATIKYIFDPLNMENSIFSSQVPSKCKAFAAQGHNVDGSLRKDKWDSGAILAAGGLWTTPFDYAKLIVELQKSVDNNSNLLFTQDVIKNIFSRYYEDMGLAFLMKGEGDNVAFTHNGGNPGFRSDVFAFVYQGKGAVIMINSDRGLPLTLELYRSIAKEYNWPKVDCHYQQDTISIISLNHKELKKYNGKYKSILQTGAKIKISIKAADNNLILKSGSYSYKLYPVAKNIFKSLEFGEIEFEFDKKGKVNGFEYIFEFGYGEAN